MTMNELLSNFRETLEMDKEEILKDSYPEERLHEYADAAIPVYNGDLANLLSDDPTIAYPSDSGCIDENNIDVFKILQWSIYERLNDEGYEWLLSARDEQRGWE